jgi:hypothetical protein
MSNVIATPPTTMIEIRNRADSTSRFIVLAAFDVFDKERDRNDRQAGGQKVLQEVGQREACKVLLLRTRHQLCVLA